MDQYTQRMQLIPINVQQLAEAQQLGAPTAVYTNAGYGVFIGSAVLFICFVIPILSALLTTLTNPASYPDGPPIAVDLFFLAAVLAAIGLVFYTYRYRRVYIYMGGLIYRTWLKTGVLRWEHIAMVQQDTNRVGGLRVRTTDGTQVVFSLTFPVRERLAVCETIEREYLRVLAQGPARR
jgi:hypothetical protein